MRQTFDRIPPEPVRFAWCDWLRRHSVDPCDVAIPGWIERRPTRRQVAYLGFVLDGNGKKQLDPHDRYAAWRRPVVVQLESSPASFPTIGKEDG